MTMLKVPTAPAPARTAWIKPVADCILVKPDEVEKVSRGGIILPDTATREKQQTRGKILAMGPGKLADDGRIVVAPRVEVGDVVVFGKYAGADIDVDGAKLKIIREHDILAVIVYPRDEKT